MIGEPPIHVDGAADALEFILHPGWKTDIAVANGLCFARTRFTDDGIPRKLIEVLAARFVSLDAGLEFLPHVIQAGALAGIADTARCGRTMLGNIATKLLVLLLL